jgi:deglycase
MICNFDDSAVWILVPAKAAAWLPIEGSNCQHRVSNSQLNTESCARTSKTNELLSLGRREMANSLQGKKIAILATDGFEQVELLKPRQALQEAGAQTQVVSPKDGKIKGWNLKEWGEEVSVDTPLKSADPANFDGLLLPGGVMNPDHLRMDAEALRFVKHFFDEGKPVAAICHGPWMLVEADVVRGRTITSWPSLKTDIRNAGGNWVDREVVRDNQVVTSRKPDDIPAFNREMIGLFAQAAIKPQLKKSA